MTLALEELYTHDWKRPNVVPLAYEFAAPLPNYGESTDFATALARLLIQMGILKSLQTLGAKVEEKIDAPLLTIALVFCPLAIAEANRQRRHFDEGLSQCRQLLDRHAQFKILSETIEKPFVKILKAQILLDKADSQYKSRALANSPATNPDGSLRYQGLEAAETYQGVLAAFEDQGEYVNRVNAGVDAMASQLNGLLQHTFDPVAASEPAPTTAPLMTPADRKAFSLIGKTIAIETIASRQGDFPDPDRRIRPHEPLVRIAAPDNDPPLRETNPVIYALTIQARSRLLQMESGLNYLGYGDDYVPPWRFQFLLDRARYFAEHAKNAQREYLNFLTNAEREEFQELTAAQNVEMEKSNVRLESARVDQAQAEVEGAKASDELAALTARNAFTRAEAYATFNQRADDLSDQVLAGSAVSTLGAIGSGILSGALAGGVGGAIVGGISGLLSGGGQTISEEAQLEIAGEQRDFEEKSLGLTASEADQAALVAQRQLAVSQSTLLVAGFQRAAAVLRHEAAVQNLTYLRNRTLNAELWYRLASTIRDVADMYLRYGIEMGFLAEQAYEFEADKRINVIRFDYDISDLGNMMAGDFLLRDLDTLEQDLVVGQRIRQQQVRFVVSLAREFPDALQQLRADGSTIFTIRLEQLERRFPGLFNLRIRSVELLPLALMDATRLAVQVTQLGSGYVRLSATPHEADNPVAGIDWLTGVEDEWSVRLRTTPPETAVFSGLSRADTTSGSASFIAANQLGAFEAVAAASAWRVDLSMKENRIVPDSLADLLVTFTLSGYYDGTLRDAVDNASQRPMATTTWLSAHQSFSDAYYQFNQSGRMEWSVTQDLLSLQGSIGALRNVGLLALPASRRPELGRIVCSYPIEFEVDAAANITLRQSLPMLSFTTNGLSLQVSLNAPLGAAVTFDFGDGTGLFDSSTLTHAYARPGRYDVLVRIAQDQRLTEYHAAVVVSRQHSVAPPCIAVPDLNPSVSGGRVKLEPTLQVPSGESLAVSWRIDGREADPSTPTTTFLLDPGRYVLRFAAVRSLGARFYSTQRYDTSSPIVVDALRVATNRTFDATTGAETTTSINPFGQHVFAGDALSPVDRWTFELPLDENPPVLSVSASDVMRYDLSELSDVFLTLEFTTGE